MHGGSRAGPEEEKGETSTAPHHPHSPPSIRNSLLIHLVSPVRALQARRRSEARRTNRGGLAGSERAAVTQSQTYLPAKTATSMTNTGATTPSPRPPRAPMSVLWRSKFNNDNISSLVSQPLPRGTLHIHPGPL
ncbi:hypothetical protein DPEC_G00350480 [Dallia pectoralis]|uniref:Uncharacterized protein n=1 Tax=Dallia pectoralis TaxID=75939 RepID=A0ACC2F1T8_DALPE|nr:hypothetical protein DPEC_G00350480 [Dallia pectoralis]